ncbi:MAG: type II toxin-antitoxin system Phd/YefM family antitoxin [Longimicrobiales bacterium]|nr:type II toxin-antitoxin system Phd/YefM family antitoxin [Longimicrobiales bacterium]
MRQANRGGKRPEGAPLTIREVALTSYGAERPVTVISASEFRERCLQLMDQVQRERTEVVITKHGKPVAKLVPAEAARNVDYFGALEHLGPVVWHVDPDRLTEDTEGDEAWERRWSELLRSK